MRGIHSTKMYSKLLAVAFFIFIILVSVLFLLKYRGILNKSIPPPDIQTHLNAAIESCRGNITQCNQTAKELMEYFPVKELLSTLETNITDPKLSTGCHELLHFIGRNEYKRLRNITEALTEGSTICYAGFYHGILEEFLIEKSAVNPSDRVTLANLVPTMCRTKTNFENTNQFYQCLHGLGHALMFATANEILDALRLCDELPESTQSEWCYSGVFMENATSSTNKDHPSKYLKANDPFFPCSILEHKYLNTCYIVQSGYFGKITGNNFPTMIALCQKVPKDYEEKCFDGLGQQQTGFINSAESLKENCNMIDSVQFKKSCINGVVIGLYQKNNSQEQIVNFCSLFETDLKAYCLEVMSNTFGNSIHKP